MGERTIELEVLRYNPETDSAPHFQRYSVACREEWVVLDALNHIKEAIDPTLSYRWSCHMAVCGSCGMMVNGEPKLACKSFIRNYEGVIRVEPLAHFPIERDLVTTTGHGQLVGDTLLYVRDGVLLGQRLNPETRQISGRSVPLALSVGSDSNGRGYFTASRRVLLAAPGVSRRYQLTWFPLTDGAGTPTREPGDYWQVRLSPDDRYAALTQTTPLDRAASTRSKRPRHQLGSATRMPISTLGTRARRAASTPTTFAWKRKHCTTCGCCCRKHSASRRTTKGNCHQRRAASDRTSMPASARARTSCPWAPSGRGASE